MDIDIYQQCPCHTDKKIKFCCGKGVVGDLNQILSKSSSGQSAAALDQIDRLIEKDGPKDCLLTIQTHILISSGDTDKAQEVNAKFLEANPGHATGLHHKSLISLAKGDVGEAIEVLQDAMDAIKGNEIPVSLGNAFKMVGFGLLNQGNSFAAHEHLKYAYSLKGDSDPELQQMLMEIYRGPNTPMLLKQDFQLAPPIEGVAWEKRYRNVHRALARGQFRKSLQFLQKIDEAEPDHPEIVRGLAIVNSFLGRVDDMIAAWRRYARLDAVGKAAAAEAEAIAQIFDDSNAPESVALVRKTIEVTETDGASEAALSSSRLVSTPQLPQDPFDEGPPPRSVFIVLDKDQINSPDELTIDNVPEVIGEILLYGKQTDRDARLEVVSVEDGRDAKIQALIDETFKGFVSGEPKRQELGETNELAEMFEWKWHLPEGVTKKDHDELVRSRREQVLLNDWVNVKFPMLDGKTPVEAASEGKYEACLQGMIILLENAASGHFFDDDLMDQLRDKLGIKRLPNVEYDENHVGSPVLQQQLDYGKLSDEALLRVRADAIQIGNIKVLRGVVPETLKRDDIGVPKHMSYSMLAQIAQDDEEALAFCAKACETAKADGVSEGIYLVQEFEMRIARGMTDKLQEILQKLQMNHLDEPEVEYRLVRVLDRYGIGPDQGPIRRGAPQQAPQAAAPEQAGGIWTPDGGGAAPAQAPPAAEPESGEKSGLWIPD
jgi:tetratricopeptide (TPR) repeat protein